MLSLPGFGYTNSLNLSVAKPIYIALLWLDCCAVKTETCLPFCVPSNTQGCTIIVNEPHVWIVRRHTWHAMPKLAFNLADTAKVVLLQSVVASYIQQSVVKLAGANEAQNQLDNLEANIDISANYHVKYKTWSQIHNHSPPQPQPNRHSTHPEAAACSPHASKLDSCQPPWRRGPWDMWSFPHRLSLAAASCSISHNITICELSGMSLPANYALVNTSVVPYLTIFHALVVNVCTAVCMTICAYDDVGCGSFAVNCMDASM